MPKYLHLIIFVYLIMSFNFNSLLPLYRDASIDEYAKYNQRCKFIDRTKKMASNTIRKIKDTTHDFGKNIYDHFNGFKSFVNRNIINEDDIRQYEQLVIMKKYPYLDIHELEMKYFPLKNSRHGDNIYLDQNMQPEARIIEPGEDLLNVEITNRGLSGFAIPTQFSKHERIECKSKSITTSGESPNNIVFAKKSPNSNVLRSLTKEINAYIEKKHVPFL